MNIIARLGDYVFDDFCHLVKDEEKADLIDGVIYMASPENTAANDLFMWLGGLMYDFAEIRQLGKVFGSRVAFRLDDRNAPEPDIAFVSKKHLRRVLRNRIEGPPDLGLEIVSPESVERDYRTKREQYERARVPEYWIVDEAEEKVTVLRLGAKAKYREVRPSKGELHSKVLPGFWIRPEWLWRKPRPKKTEILTHILSRQG
ncbi:MAG TPA: Uma2 family endonuclease [Gemmataceae bacterium]|jgi:Uma2 family endonuclease|nr:Uma2 family endonuclease [Gemmataceae bacterium]